MLFAILDFYHNTIFKHFESVNTKLSWMEVMKREKRKLILSIDESNVCLKLQRLQNEEKYTSEMSFLDQSL